MNRKQYLTAMIAIIVIDLALIITNYFFGYMDFIWVFVIILAGYLFLRYKVSGSLQTFSTKFNMLVEYDLEVQQAKELVEENLKKAPTKNMQAFYMVYLGMAKYYCGEYDEAIKTFNQIELKKLNPAYHILIFAFSAYASFELEDFENFNMYLERIKNLSANINRRYLGFVNSYIQVLEAIQGLENDPEHYREVIEGQFSKFDGYISTKLIYNFRMAYYYRAINDEVEMDKCLAKVIANGKNHHTAIRAKELFKNNVKVEDYVFQEEAPEEYNVTEEDDQQLLTNQMDNVEDVEEVESVDDED